MIVQFHPIFKKRYKKLRDGERQRFEDRLKSFIKNPFDPVLNNHHLKGEYLGCRSIDIGGDLRTIYNLIQKDIVLFIELGTHDELYS